jgi:hypothetical protein
VQQVCAHCHVDAGPDRKEIMTVETMQQILDVLKTTEVTRLNWWSTRNESNFRWFVEEASNGVKDFIVRSNLTIIRANKNIMIYLNFQKTCFM